MAATVVLTTLGSEKEAKRLAGELVERKLAACVNILPNVTSVYRWQGKVHEDPEVLLVIKTARDRYEDLESAIQELHPYDLPEIVCLSVDRGEAGYLAWISGEVGSP